MNRIINRAKTLLIVAAVLAGGALAFFAEYLFQAEDWVMFPGSPHVYGNQNSGKGQIVDRDGKLLLDTMNGWVYSEEEQVRTSMVHWLGDRKGNISAPLLSHYAKKLSGYDLINGVHEYGDVGGTLKLTLSSAIQKAALEAMGDHKGTLAVYNYKTGELLCAVSTPAFDPDNPPDIAGDTEGVWDGAYVNRFLKSVYTPGSIFKIVTAAAALETIPDIMEQKFTCTGELEYGVDKVTCMESHGTMTFQDAFMVSCNCAFAQIAGQLGGDTLERFAKQLGITQSIPFDGLTTTAGSIEAAGTADVLTAWSGIGQHKDLINPCQYLTLVGAIASGGSGLQPYIVAEAAGPSWNAHRGRGEPTGRLMSSETAATLQRFMRNNVENYYGEELFQGLTVCAKSGTAEVGGGKKPNAMFAGFVQDENCPIAFIVAVENGGYGRPVCAPILSQVLAACKQEFHIS